MRTLVRYALSIIAAAALLAACGGSQPPIGAVGASNQTSHAGTIALPPPTSSYQVLHSFGRHVNRSRDRGGANPGVGLINVGGTLYGTTSDGGISGCDWGCGTVYSISTTGKKKTLYGFRGGSSDGALPASSLIDVNGTLYGTTYFGGNSTCHYGFECGTVFSLTPAGVETVLYKFQGGSDGAFPDSRLVDINGTLYGTTAEGGGSGCSNTLNMTYGCGTVYGVTTSGQEKVLYAFQDYADGEDPGGLIAVKGTLYGTTRDGGSPDDCGIVFKITTSGSEKLVHDFNCYSDGQNVSGPLIDVKGTLYGTTEFGGATEWGTVFSMSTKGSEKVLYNFAGVPDGAVPNGGLIYLNGKFYGTTLGGGSSTCGTPSYAGCGTIYSVTPSGSERVLHRFQGGSDGVQPLASLVGVNGTLFGTTSVGGSSTCRTGTEAGCGIVFALTP